MEWFVGWISTILGTVLFFLPDDPLMPYIQSIEGADWLGYLNWFIPIGTMVTIGGMWLGAIGVFYAYQALLRLVHAIGS